MKQIRYIFILLLFSGRLFAQDISGDWAGFLSVQGGKLKIVFHIRMNEGKLNTTFDSPDQNAMGLKFEETSLNGNEILMSSKALGMQYQGHVSKAVDTISGLWVQGGRKLPLVVARTTIETVKKTVNPYETDIVLKTPTGDINGTLTMPEQSQPVPVVLIIAGSGPTDRDGNSPPILRNNSNCYKMLAEDLRKMGIASVRYDKRGIAGSKAAAQKESDLRFENYVADASAWIARLSLDKHFSKIIVAGHSEGSLIGMIASGQSGVNGFISIAGSGRPAGEILKEQFGSLPKDDKDRIYGMLDKLEKGDTIGNVPKELYAFFRPSLQPYMISWFKYDPAAEIRKLKMPVLIIQGDMDIQVSVNDAELLAKAKRKASLKIIKNMNHILKDTDTKDKMEQVSKVYTDPDLPLDKTFEDEVVKFIGQVR